MVNQAHPVGAGHHQVNRMVCKRLIASPLIHVLTIHNQITIFPLFAITKPFTANEFHIFEWTCIKLAHWKINWKFYLGNQQQSQSSSSSSSGSSSGSSSSNQQSESNQNRPQPGIKHIFTYQILVSFMHFKIFMGKRFGRL